MKKKVIVSLLMLVGGIVLFFDSADAATVFSYDGTGIRNWDSKGRNNIAKGKKVSVKHTQSKWSNSNTQQAKTMKITLRRKNTVGYTNVGNVSYSGNVTNSSKVLNSKLGTAGTHYLRFDSTKPAGATANPTANIKGVLSTN